jgi:hypothetical protein
MSVSSSENSSNTVLNVIRIIFYHQCGKTYDEITIRPVSTSDSEYNDCEFHVTYNYDRTDDRVKSVNEMILTGDNVVDYVNRMIRMVAYDEVPFLSCSFEIPMFPTVSYGPKLLRKKAVRSLIIDGVSDYVTDCINGEYDIEYLDDIEYDCYDEDAVYSESE